MKKMLWILLYFLSPALPVYFYIVQVAKNNNDLLFLIGGALGICSYVFFVNQFIITARPKFIERNFGMDKMYRFHMVMAIVAFIFGLIHSQIKDSYFRDSFQTTLGSATLVIFGAIIVISTLLMINKLFFKIKIVDEVRNLLKKLIKPKHEFLIAVHNITVIGVCILLIHILLSESVKTNIPLEITLTVYFAIALSMYLNHKVLKRSIAKSKEYTISDIVKERENIITLKLKPKNNKLFNYKPGQFLYVKLYNTEIPKDEHPFTISSRPAEKDYVSVTVKQLGDFTNSIVKAKIGNKAYVDGSFGCFTYLDLPKDNKLCFIAGGIGITPFLSMLRYLNVKEKAREVILIWGVRDNSELICYEELNSIASNMKNLTIIAVLSSDKKYNGEQGYVDGARVKRLLKDNLDYDFFLCGPKVMMEKVVVDLKIFNIDSNKIHFEKFSI
ncbi:ferredoxin reductase family protein [Clostridium sp.]|jgi:predicted ferric reductase|uniref:ferredoxin reductase family protein n=1 Tax=Clostridium sp. TaxID=1506 RepID=UPI003EEE5A60